MKRSSETNVGCLAAGVYEGRSLMKQHIQLNMIQAHILAQTEKNTPGDMFVMNIR